VRVVDPDPSLASLLAKFREAGGVLDYVFLEAEGELRAMAVIGASTTD